MKMSPYEIKTLLNVFVSPASLPDAPILRDTMQLFYELDLVKPKDQDFRAWEMTPRGEAFCRAVCATPIPEPRWVLLAQAERII